jgi:hypothetical protein
MSIRTELESNVVSVNNVLKDKVHEMDYIELLRNSHPSYRSDFAHRLFSQKLISEAQAKEFTVTVRIPR